MAEEATEIAAIARIRYAEDLLRKARYSLQGRENPGGTMGYDPDAAQFAKWDEERRAMKEREAQALRGQTRSFEAMGESLARGYEPSAVRIPARIGAMPKRPLGGAAKRAWGLRTAESSLRRSGWLAGPRTLPRARNRRGRRYGKRRRMPPRDRLGRFLKRHKRRVQRRGKRRGYKRRRSRRNPLPRWVDRRSVRTIFRGKGKKRRRLLVGCPRGSWSAKRGRCKKGMRLVEKKRR